MRPRTVFFGRAEAAAQIGHYAAILLVPVQKGHQPIRLFLRFAHGISFLFKTASRFTFTHPPARS
jgi:hypothetical protein